MSSWSTRWNEFADSVCEHDALTLAQAADLAAASWPELAPFLASLELPETPPSPAFRAFVEAVDADLALEARETPTDLQYPTQGEGYESIARQMGRVLARAPELVAAASPFDRATGLRTPYTVATLLTSASCWLRSVAQWYGEPVGMAGEKRRRFDPDDLGDGDSPYSTPS